MGFFNIFGGNNNFDLIMDEARKDNSDVILDVRTPEEFFDGRVPGAVNVPLDSLENASLDKSKKYYVYCHSGARSTVACGYLKKHGYDCINAGGIMSYRGNIER